jgi:hypothetical protein
LPQSGLFDVAWPFGRLRLEREKKLRDPHDVLIEGDRRQQLKKRGHSDAELC